MKCKKLLKLKSGISHFPYQTPPVNHHPKSADVMLDWKRIPGFPTTAAGSRYGFDPSAEQRPVCAAFQRQRFSKRLGDESPTCRRTCDTRWLDLLPTPFGVWTCAAGAESCRLYGGSVRFPGRKVATAMQAKLLLS